MPFLNPDNMLNKYSKTVLVVTLSAFVAVVLLDPGDQILHMKLPLFILAIVVWVIRIAFRAANPGCLKMWAAIMLFAFIMPCIASIIGMLDGTLPLNEPRYFQIVKSSSMLLLIPLLASEKFDISKHIVNWSLFIAIMTLALAVLSIVAPLPFLMIGNYILDHENAFISSSGRLGLGIGSIYYKSVSLLLFPISYYFRNLLYYPNKFKSFVLAGIFLASVMCTDNRAMVLGAFSIIAFLVFQKIKKQFGLVPALSILLLMIAIPGGYFATFFNLDDYCEIFVDFGLFSITFLMLMIFAYKDA